MQLAIVLMFAVAPAWAQDNSACGSLSNHYGPFDYRTANSQQKSLVESFHFTPRIEYLLPGGSNPWADDISYTLRAFPNHHRALLTIQRLAEREKTDTPKSAQWSVACYFDRALRFQPKDVIVKMLYAGYLAKKNRVAEATQQLDAAITLGEDEPFTQFNVGLVFLDMKNFDRALVQAHRALAMGFTRPELRDALIAAGKWVEPPAKTEEPTPKS